ncbi:hypothetical protein GA0115240_140624 [Streptomyces sp. DvalAA-14]|uniref:hypothetical protein n=1 Tax=unclassified Streptomyces TaxID=2593676 RepID=UPI00081BB75E|nr:MULTISPECIES: hypothetical protein [unclassified Streptomyces]MYS22345.1 hypothetical protein [Streptomyces sp. SID4948]SCE14350.1 hypothetical protein GA0115240_140624 [Streptomyces sp. DvalAA-14]
MNARQSPRPRAVPALCTAAITLLALTGCSGHPGNARAEDSHSPAPVPTARTPRPGTGTSAATDSAGGTRIRSLAHFDITENQVSHVQVWSHYLLYSSADPSLADGRTDDKVTVIDLTTRKAKVVARSRYPRGQCDIAAGVGDYIAWTDQPAMQTDDTRDVSWKMHLTSIRTGHDQVIATSRGAERIVPVPAASAGHVVWTQLTKDKRAGEVHSYDIATGTNRTLISGVGPSSTSVAGRWVVYDTATRQGTDVFEIPVDGGNPQRLTTSGKAALPRAQAGRVVWQEPDQGDPTSLWTRSLDGRDRPTKAVSGPTEGNAVPGTGFIAYWGAAGASSAVMVTFLNPDGTPGATRQVSRGGTAVRPRISSDSDRVAWGEYLTAGGEIQPGKPQATRIYVDRIT